MCIDQGRWLVVDVVPFGVLSDSFEGFVYSPHAIMAPAGHLLKDEAVVGNKGVRVFNILETYQLQQIQAWKRYCGHIYRQ